MKKRTEVRDAGVATVSAQARYVVSSHGSGVVVHRFVHRHALSASDHFLHFPGLGSFARWALSEGDRLADRGLSARLIRCFGRVCSMGSSGSLRPAFEGLSYADGVMAVIQRIAVATNQAEVLSLMHLAVRALGADASFYVSEIPEPSAARRVRVLFDLDGGNVPLGNDVAWEINPALETGRRQSEPYLVSSSDGWAGLAKSGGLFTSALVVPTPAPADSLRFGAMCFGSRSEGLFEAEQTGFARLLARVLAAEVNGWWFNASREALRRQARLSSDDLRLMLTLRVAGSIDASAHALGWSVSGLTRRLQSVRRRLCVTDWHEAVDRVREYGLLDVHT